jgi:1-pyrroline-5-carboxylate dehydrogenase
MSNSRPRCPLPLNEPVKGYAPGSPERDSLAKKLASMRAQTIEIPLRIGGRDVTTGKMGEAREPHRKGHLLAKFHQAGAAEVERAIAACRAAQPAWRAMSFEDRAAIFLKAADLLAGPWRDTLNAATMAGQSKTCHQAEIDAACELIDFFRFNVHFAEEIYAEQPFSGPGMWNRSAYRPLEGFIFAGSPFNFTSIAGNLPTAPALMGNVVVWKPASSSVYSAWFIMKLLEEAGLPAGVINLVIGSGGQVGGPALASPELAGIHFTGSTEVFNGMWKTVGDNLAKYKSYPRLVGETGGKDFVFAHASADRQALAVALVRGAFEYQGQKCSAASRAYIPKSIWPDVRDRMCAMLAEVKMGPIDDFSNFVGAVIDQGSFTRIKEYIETAKGKPGNRILSGGVCDDREGFFVQPTVIESDDPKSRTMCEEIFGPVLTIHVYDDGKFGETLRLCDETSPYALTGAVFAQDRQIIVTMTQALENAAGNFYINDKPTGAVVGQQPFGGARASGTNDKAGSKLNLLRWVQARTIKETFTPPHQWRYPFLG